ncbi:hypothetical protein BDV23DRAFT_176117 [Aspergillus alliaceus]|uniref:C2H2-type domain-containing protein n=1 Tax=Petromyces alliaceus TaxID=209559 RepID=A0A5N7BUX1_PETAA|nr:hypothetical protein BDV23DRAFT_176117 [Aspergillus alliaceus]
MADGNLTTEPSLSARQSEHAGISLGQDTAEQPSKPSNSHAGIPRRRNHSLIRQQDHQSGPVFIPSASAVNPTGRWPKSPLRTSRHLSPVQRPTQARAPSATSGECSGSSNASFGFALSHSPSDDPLSRIAKGRLTKRGRVCCTFSCDKFRRRYELARHEKPLHLNLETWYCVTHGTTVFSRVTERKHYAFANTLDPNAAHLDRHNHNACRGDSDKRRSFRRKGHLVQRLRLVHNVDTLPLIDDCKGDHEFPPSIAAQVTNSLLYLIGEESRSIIPFFAINAYLSSFTQVLALYLSRYAREKMKQGIIHTDDMFQQEARRVLYGSEDSWNQTIADNRGWLSPESVAADQQPKDTSAGMGS